VVVDGLETTTDYVKFDWLDGVIVLLQIYFILMNLTVERSYCEAPITKDSTCFLCPETYAFCEQHNRLFLERPEWMRLATCFSSYGFVWGYALIAYAAVSGEWFACRVPILLFAGAKVYALLYYHSMEFLSHVPPEHLVPYFGVEGPYLVSGFVVVWRALRAAPLKVHRD